MTQFESATEMYAAGYAIKTYNINSELHFFQYEDEVLKTIAGAVELCQNKSPSVKLAKIADVRQKEFIRPSKG